MVKCPTQRILLVLTALSLPTSMLAQGRPIRFEADSAGVRTPGTSSERRVPGSEVHQLPVDSVEGALLLQGGLTATAAGLSFRGAAPGEYATVLDGIDVTPGVRRVRLGFGTNALSSATAVIGSQAAALGNSSAGVLLLETAKPAFGRAASLSYESDRFPGPSLGLNRLEASLGGMTRSATVFFAGTITKQESAEFGAGARDLPIYVSAGTDTTVAIPGAPGNPLSDTTYFDLPAFAVSRGDCDPLRGSANPGIADNYGESCRGDRTPASRQSGYRLLAAGEYRLGRASKLDLLSWRGRESSSLFSYPDLYNSANLFEREAESSVHSLSISGPLGQRRSGGAYRLGVSRQRDQRIVGPSNAEGDLRWDFETFPVDSELVANYRANLPGTRRSPYDLENTDQYRLWSQFRDDAYGVGGFPESGGPVGRLELFRERRTVAFANATWSVSRNAVFTAGGEYTRYTIANYDHQLTSQLFSDVYEARPIRGALFAEDRLVYGPLTFIGGVRYDFYSSRAVRPVLLDTVQLAGGQPSATFGTYQPFPRISSYDDADGRFTVNGMSLPLVDFVQDERRTAWSPRFRASFAAGKRTLLRAGWTRHAAMPDLGLVFAGVNTDLAITSVDAVFGSDLGLERSWLAELGLHHSFGTATSFDLAGYRRSTRGAPTGVIRTLNDPTRHNTVDLRFWDDVGRATAQGLEAVLEHRVAGLAATLAYTLQRVRLSSDAAGLAPAASVIAPWERPHTLSATIGYTAAESRRGFWRGAGAWVAFRMSSGLTYRSCGDNGGELSDEPCETFGGGSLAARRMPAFRQLDLRFSRRLGARPGAIAFFVDARNLLNRNNVLRVFRSTGTTANEAAREAAIQSARTSMMDEASDNGVLAGNDDINLQFGGDGAGGCAHWVTVQGDGGAPNCVALVRAEQRFGNGDGVYSAEEQRTAAGAAFDVLRTSGMFATPRRIRVGLEATF